MAAPSPARTGVESVRRLSEPLVQACGLVLEEITITPAGRRQVLRIVVDLPETDTGGVPLDAVAEVSQALSTALDGAGAMGAAPYVLEVSSPGADRPLTQRRHWLRARGRLVRVDAVDGAARTGRLTDVGDDGVCLAGGPTIGWELIRAGQVELDFSLPVPDDDLDDDELPDDDLDQG